jgi:GNAT superfamily N-acetyltransferase
VKGVVAEPRLDVRDAGPADLDALADLWHEAWRAGHAAVVPPALVRLRTRDNFRDRLARALAEVRVVGDVGAPLAFYIIKGDELAHFFVAAPARGTGLAATLIRDAEARLAGRGVSTAWLACAVGNDRAARFYEKCGWHRLGVVTLDVETSAGAFPLDVWRYEKALCGTIPSGRHR